MKLTMTKKILGWPLSVLTFFFPIASFAASYVALEPDVFSGFTGSANTNDLGQFLSEAFQFGLAIAAALAVIMIVWGGVEVMLSESVFKKTNGRQRVWDAIWGLLLALVSWLILYTINPTILNWSSVVSSTP